MNCNPFDAALVGGSQGHCLSIESYCLRHNRIALLCPHRFKPQLFNRAWLEVREKGESSPFYRENPKKIWYPCDRAFASATPCERGHASERASGRTTRVHARLRGHGPAWARASMDLRSRVRTTSARAQVNARSDSRQRCLL
jgi:hypothetical protein